MSRPCHPHTGNITSFSHIIFDVAAFASIMHTPTNRYSGSPARATSPEPAPTSSLAGPRFGGAVPHRGAARSDRLFARTVRWR
jgi:hypothetical protein